MPFGRQVYEPPPPEWDSGPFPKGEPHIVYFDDIDKLNAWCKSWGVDPQGRTARINGCYAVQFNMIGVPNPKSWPGGQREVDQLIRHEKGHARGGVHGKNRHEWVPGQWLIEHQRKNALADPNSPAPNPRNALAPQGR